MGRRRNHRSSIGSPPRRWRKIRGDLRILEILQQKDEQANLNLGDPASFLNVYDPDKEVDKVSEFMANGMMPAQVSATLDTQHANAPANAGDWLLQLFGGAAVAPAQRRSPSPPRAVTTAKPGQASSRANMTSPGPP